MTFIRKHYKFADADLDRIGLEVGGVTCSPGHAVGSQARLSVDADHKNTKPQVCGS